MPSLARVLEKQGYETMAMHPAGEAAWNRNRVYSYFEFDDFIHYGDWRGIFPYYVMMYPLAAAGYFKLVNKSGNLFDKFIHKSLDI